MSYCFWPESSCHVARMGTALFYSGALIFKFGQHALLFLGLQFDIKYIKLHSRSLTNECIENIVYLLD